MRLIGCLNGQCRLIFKILFIPFPFHVYVILRISGCRRVYQKKERDRMVAFLVVYLSYSDNCVCLMMFVFRDH